MANVFICHRKDDDKKAERLAAEIRGAGHNVWIDLWNIEIGDSIVERINEGLESANYVIVCYSTIGIDSPWIKREWSTTLTNQLNGKNLKLLPVVLTGGGPPYILSDLFYVDLTKDWSEGIKRVLHAIR
jgi:TIR domain